MSLRFLHFSEALSVVANVGKVLKMAAQVIAKLTGATINTPVDAIALTAPSIVRLQLNRDAISSLERSGDDLIIQLEDGNAITVGNFYQTTDGVTSDLVLRDTNGQQWLAQSGSRFPRFFLLNDLDKLMGAASAGSAAGSSLMMPPAAFQRPSAAWNRLSGGLLACPWRIVTVSGAVELAAATSIARTTPSMLPKDVDYIPATSKSWTPAPAIPLPGGVRRDDPIKSADDGARRGKPVEVALIGVPRYD
jgi:hypothetical protein